MASHKRKRRKRKEDGAVLFEVWYARSFNSLLFSFRQQPFLSILPLFQPFYLYIFFFAIFSMYLHMSMLFLPFSVDFFLFSHFRSFFNECRIATFSVFKIISFFVVRAMYGQKYFCDDAHRFYSCTWNKFFSFFLWISYKLTWSACITKENINLLLIDTNSLLSFTA